MSEESLRQLHYSQPPAPAGSRVGREICGVLLMLLIFSAAFGFLASFEAVPNAIVWRTGYASFGLACFATGAGSW